MNFKQIFKQPINVVFSASLALVILVALGIIPRFGGAFLVLVLILGFILRFPLRQGVSLFLRSIPFFIALPITQNFDNFSTWRIVLVVIFLKWLFTQTNWLKKETVLKSDLNKKYISIWLKKNKIEALGILFFGISFLSLFVAHDYIAGTKQIIYLLNAVFLFIVVKDLIAKDKGNFFEFTKNFAYSGILAVAVGYIQFISAYFTPAGVFHYWWGQVFSLGMYGTQWANIVTNFGNTWFSYSGDTLRLRMFSTFPDSHSFPIYVIMTLPSIMVLGFSRIKIFYSYLMGENKKLFKNLKWNSPQANFIVGLALLMLALILSGTRGIWLAILPTMAAVWILKRMGIPKRFIKITANLSLLFLFMFPFYFGIVSFRQFQDTGFSAQASFARLRSLVSFSETSNSGRIYIWKETIESISKSPLLGVGAGNYPVVLDELQTAARAGASAHNLYLHIASTIGVFGLLVFLWFLWDLLIKSIKYLKHNKHPLYSLYIAVSLFSFVWIFSYLMTDAALFDGRASLAFMALLGTMVPILNKKNE